jgi:DNA-binding NarL/FixJ family response regulator
MISTKACLNLMRTIYDQNLLYWVENDSLLVSSISDNLKNAQPELEIQIFHSGESLITSLENERLPALLILDINLPGQDGTTIAQYIKTKFPEIKILFISFFDSYAYIKAAIALPAEGYLIKGESSLTDFTEAIVSVMSGRTYFPVNVMKTVFDDRRVNKSTPELSKTESDICNFLAKGLSVDEIEVEIQLSKHVINSYKKMMFKKYKVKNSTHLIAVLMCQGLINSNLIEHK